jgi:hypothetical protein
MSHPGERESGRGEIARQLHVNGNGPSCYLDIMETIFFDRGSMINTCPCTNA